MTAYKVSVKFAKVAVRKIPRKAALTMTTEKGAPVAPPRSIAAIAREIRADWKAVNFAAVPYLDAMRSLDSVTDNYGADSARSIVLYFLGNASTWRGPVAKRIKAELKSLVNAKR